MSTAFDLDIPMDPSAVFDEAGAAGAPVLGDDEVGGEMGNLLGDPFFRLPNEQEEASFNQYRLRYQSFRRGNAVGAKGEVDKSPLVAQPANPPSIPSTVVPPFLAKLYDILESNLYGHLISWNTDGTRVVLKKLDEFSKTVLPKYFKHSNFSSFLRQLNMYVRRRGWMGYCGAPLEVGGGLVPGGGEGLRVDAHAACERTYLVCIVSRRAMFIVVLFLGGGRRSNRGRVFSILSVSGYVSHIHTHTHTPHGHNLRECIHIHTFTYSRTFTFSAHTPHGHSHAFTVQLSNLSA